MIEVAVCGVQDDTWGERVGAVMRLRDGVELGVEDLREWGGSRMAPYTIPSIIKCVDDIPKNAMGKVNKKELVKIF